MGHFVSSTREREKRDRRDSRGDERERQGRKSSGTFVTENHIFLCKYPKYKFTKKIIRLAIYIFGVVHMPKLIHTVNVQRFQTLNSILFGPKFCFLCSCFIKYFIWNGKQ